MTLETDILTPDIYIPEGYVNLTLYSNNNCLDLNNLLESENVKQFISYLQLDLYRRYTAMRQAKDVYNTHNE